MQQKAQLHKKAGSVQKFLQLAEAVGSSCTGSMNVEVLILKDDSGKDPVSKNLDYGQSSAKWNSTAERTITEHTY